MSAVKLKAAVEKHTMSTEVRKPGESDVVCMAFDYQQLLDAAFPPNAPGERPGQEARELKP